MRHRSIKAVYSYWDTLRGNRSAPFRTEVDPRGIAAELGDVFLLDGSASDYRFRLAGSRMVASLGQTLTGKRFDEIWFNTISNSVKRALSSPAEEGEPILIGIRAFEPSPARPPSSESSQRIQPRWPNLRIAGSTTHQERSGILIGAGEMLLLPLNHQGRIGGRILGAMALFETPAVPASGPQPLDISGTRILGRAALPSRGTGLLHSEMADTIISRRGHLVVMQGSGPIKQPSNPEN